MKLSIVTDELSSDLETALELARSLHVDAVEIRGVGEGRYPDVTPLMRVRVPELVSHWGLPVVAISPGLFKIPHADEDVRRVLRWEDAALLRLRTEVMREVARHVEELLPASLAACQEVGAQVLVCFSFDRPTDASGDDAIPSEVVEILRHAAGEAAASGIQLAVEVEAGCWCSDSSSGRRLIDALGDTPAGLNWDPANAFRAGEDDPCVSGYARVAPFVRHVHFKDARTNAFGQRVFVVDGELDWAAQIAALQTSGYDGAISIETHQMPKIEMSRRARQRLHTLIAAEARTP